MIARTAPAKVNLYLRIVGRRDDGYHLLDSLIAFASLADQVTAEPADTLSLEVDGPFAAALADQPADDNLVLRAARALAAALDIAPRARLRLTKNIPVAAGLGGGSADAAAALHVLVALWHAELPEERLRAIAAGLGADVPVCLAGRAAVVSGIGDVMAPAPTLPACGLLLVNPGVPLPTPSVFQAAARRAGAGFAEPLPIGRAPASVQDLAQALAVRGNDLTEAAISLVPEIAQALARLRATPGCRLAAMSGSGATCFALYDDLMAAEHARLALRDARPLWWSDAGALL
ncbi:MAG TPA: 4-(cytidine 5'-diphospho)-2-C-methyl-D-erythritol kinase [Vineibacter sp.]|nr:4-(cytidine 5'-diphospho)-2-C-methyl-D-erythritol kinase [Vineibacter sp.]